MLVQCFIPRKKKVFLIFSSATALSLFISFILPLFFLLRIVFFVAQLWLYCIFGPYVFFGLLVLYLFGSLAIFLVIWFSIYLVLWIRSNGSARPQVIALQSEHRNDVIHLNHCFYPWWRNGPIKRARSTQSGLCPK